MLIPILSLIQVHWDYTVIIGFQILFLSSISSQQRKHWKSKSLNKDEESLKRWKSRCDEKSDDFPPADDSQWAPNVKWFTVLFLFHASNTRTGLCIIRTRINTEAIPHQTYDNSWTYSGLNTRANVQRAALYCDYGCEDVASGSSEAEPGFYSCNQTHCSQSGNDENFNFLASPNKNTPSVDSLGGLPAPPQSSERLDSMKLGLQTEIFFGWWGC